MVACRGFSFSFFVLAEITCSLFFHLQPTMAEIGPISLENRFDHQCGGLSVEDRPLQRTKIPWTANLYLRTESIPDQTFTAMILSPQIVLTRANIFFSQKKDKKFEIFSLSSYEVRSNITKFSETTVENPWVQSSHITHIRIHPEFNREGWITSENDFAILHLDTPIEFDNSVHSVCTPTVKEMKYILSNLDSSSFVLMSGWKRHEQLGTVLRLRPNSQKTCEEFWMNESETSLAKYYDRLCVNVSTENTHINCVNKDIGTFVRVNTSFYFLGLVNNFYSDNRTCTSKARIFINENTPNVLRFIENNTICGPSKFTCNNGDCIPLNGTLCNKISDCSDSSDEDPHYCRGLNYCNGLTEFACGVYGACINKSKNCNGEIDCENGEDENDCARPPAAVSPTVIVVLVLASVGILVLLISSVIFWRKMKIAEQKLRNLTDEEVEEFQNGTTINIHSIDHVYSNCPTKPATHFGWDKDKFEIPMDKLKIEWESVLGSGIAGVVYNGVCHVANSSTSVAIKTFKSTADVENLKSLLTELKIMTKVGNHENIVNLIGAYTQEIKQRVLYMVVELCPNGSLEGYLKTNRNTFVNLFEPENASTTQKKLTTNNYENKKSNDKDFTTLDLIRWSHEIANGMEYLASKNITHGDLATRNVLITESFNAKISDFGLSRNLYESGIYVKKQMAPLPWRWMAVESLRDFEFSTRSDVWAYGVTIWELFSLGSVPFPGLHWTAEFVNTLYQGLRMSKPDYASTEIYNKMLQCWEIEPSLRPDFTSLKICFQKLEEAVQQYNLDVKNNSENLT